MAEAGIDDAFVIGGDATPPLGPYASAGELLPLVHEHPHRPRTIGIGGYPEGHPLIDDATLAQVLQEKSRLADYITTQLCFDPDALARLGAPDARGGHRAARRRRRAGHRRPRASCSRSRCASASGRRSRSCASRAGCAASCASRARSADRLYDALAPHVGDPALNLAGFHYFTFNRLLETWTWEQRKSGARETPLA